ncbi:exosome complex RNA-binding protein Csl4 [Pyrococcus abyssi]|uniref:Exosome complex component Csl4 n=1 Tax=Pyrococcus abyssi (strain GE5 / Orsay) TaxID=272844 RepID=Q9V2M2_PYRAB|nr:exosome complex RNA-binding protein Csl4 [Pyrococcus abyssi]CAB48976.1 RNA-binding protein, putative, containing S1 RNA binding domain [Pyrococcus abyssi GE5]CCE69425.1 TPA: exosome complex RNA-binding protein Csl4 [Pyrococcus abyssi GE5]
MEEGEERKKTIKNGDFVLPGDYLGVIEEYLPGEGVIVEDGNLYSARAGWVKINKDKVEISLEPASSVPPIPKKGDIVYARVIDVKQQAVLLRMIKIEGQENREIATSKLAGIHISQVKDGFVEDLRNEFKIGDIVRARVIADEKSPIQLTTKDPDLGVVYALCSKCRTPLVRKGNQLVCPRCGNVETRKISTLYRKVKL